MTQDLRVAKAKRQRTRENPMWRSRPNRRGRTTAPALYRRATRARTAPVLVAQDLRVAKAERRPSPRASDPPTGGGSSSSQNVKTSDQERSEERRVGKECRS